MSRVVEEAASELDGKVEFAEVNFDENRSHAQRLGIMGLPTNVIFRNGKVVDIIVGAGPKQEFLRRILSRLNE
jgi:thioredoxin 1